MRNLFFAIFCTAVILLHISAAGSFFRPERVPNITLALVMSLVLVLGFEKSLVWIILSGLIFDTASGYIFGTSALLLVLIGWTIGALSTVVDVKSRKLLFLPSLFLLSVIFALLFDATEGLIIRISSSWFNFHSMISSANYFSWDYVLKITFTALSVFVIYYLTKRMNKLLLFWH
jgi:rod shape-determining protein MreD